MAPRWLPAWLSFFYTPADLPKEDQSFSTYAGTALLATNLVVQFTDADKVVLEYTRPLCEVVCAAGLTMTVMLPVRRHADTRFALWTLSMLGHVAIGASVYGAPVVAHGVVVAAGALVAALVAYWIAFLLGADSWPYQLAPLELGTLCFSQLLLRLI